MSPSSPAGSGGAATGEGWLARRARVLASTPEGLDVAWLESTCRGCAGCGGRCSLFAAPEGQPERLPVLASGLRPGEDIEVLVDARALRRAAFRSYGLALVALLLGAGLGHLLGRAAGFPNAAALAGLLAGTFLAGRLTKRLDAAPRLGLRPCNGLPTKDLT
ncbi:SoxR reducing system RseC family protein [Silanimonas lenta]|uniref:SoxR reducing system RseC family protein n=1 Tax=Silanimonas lenta TaxID=265429 RepID=UPI00146F9A29|nr:SoxR reducing system RseC family protein [Silanimonas lenta]